MSDITLNLILAVSLAVFVANIYFHRYRNDKAMVFRRRLLNMASDAARKAIERRSAEWRKPYDIFDKHSYYRMVYSFRPFTLEAWFSEDEISILNGESYD